MSTSFPVPRDLSFDADHPLARAFASFTEAAGSLERTYGQLQGQVAHLRQELEVTNHDLARSLEENHRMRERLRRVLEGLPCGVLVVEEGTRITNVNPEAERLTGGVCEHLQALAPALAATLEQARASGEEQELALAAAPGVDPVWIAVRHAWLEPNHADSPSVFILRDVSEAKKLEQERERARENVRRQQALVEMSALLAHEIRNPLGSLELFAGLLAEAKLEDDSRRWVEHIQAGLRTLAATVNNVLHLHSTPQPECDPIDLGQLLDWAYEFLLPLAKQARVELQVVNGLRGVVASADRHRLEQVVLNLALNAFRFMPGGGWLSIRGRDLGAGGVEISVQDTGPGIAPQDLPRIFDAGFSTRPGSSGLGLAVCRKIVEQHGGAISVESRVGRGAAFRLHLRAGVPA
jgi:two-component system, sensor histidine kinase FlrB